MVRYVLFFFLEGFMVIIVIFILFMFFGFEKILDDIVKIRFNFRVRNYGFFFFLNNSLCLEKLFY